MSFLLFKKKKKKKKNHQVLSVKRDLMRFISRHYTAPLGKQDKICFAMFPSHLSIKVSYQHHIELQFLYHVANPWTI